MHKHAVKTHSRAQFKEGGFIALEQCQCGAVRSLVLKTGEESVVTSNWEVDDQVPEELLELIDVEPENDQGDRWATRGKTRS